MDYCSLEEAWGVKTFVTPDPSSPEPEQWSPDTPWPVSGAWGYRPAQNVQNNFIHQTYIRDGLDGVLQALPPQAIDEIRQRLASTSGLHTTAAFLLLGFVFMIVHDMWMRLR